MSARTEDRTDPLERALRRVRDEGPVHREEASRAARRLTVRIADEGLADIGYAPVDSPFGTLLAASTAKGLVRLAFPEEDLDTVLERLARTISPRIVEAPASLEHVRRELELPAASGEVLVELAQDWRLMSAFARKVLGATYEIPYGGVSSYAEVAADAGSPRGSRAAGNALGSNPIPIIVPCHRVLRTGGSIGGYGGGPERKRWLLELEGALSPAGGT
jgi:methylated-DNA-[protein]-cysteine S-methyltransferase